MIFRQPVVHGVEERERKTKKRELTGNEQQWNELAELCLEIPEFIRKTHLCWSEFQTLSHTHKRSIIQSCYVFLLM